MQDKIHSAIVGIMLSLATALGGFPCARALAYPGGPLRDVTDAAPYCAGCHSSLGIEQLRDLPSGQAQKRTAIVAHLDAIRGGTGPYAKLSPEQRALLIADVQKVDENSKISLEVPATVKAGEAFGPDGQPQDQWLSKRYDALARNLNFVVVFGIKTDLAKDKFSDASAVYDLVAPSKPGKYTICAALAYGTEKASPLGRVEMGGHPMPLGGFAGPSGRILFSKVATIQVQ